eukprot:TRINITY_DN98919_c0_g1_i1.p1 TRINITY_DN98919_c0_g1~~TRINITY_DN98919_c0_g1_i1.p1  ORF type:complete len:169 (-),score=33.50 TRINITY_DN98919_c0_g1_i1:169-618(-)
MAAAALEAAKKGLDKLRGKVQSSCAGAKAAEAPVKVAKALGSAVKGTHGFIQKRLFEGEAPTLYRLKGDKYAHCYGAPKRSDQSLQWLAPYLAGGVLTGMAVFFIVIPISFNRSYEASKKQYESFARENEHLLAGQYDRGQSARERRSG